MGRPKKTRPLDLGPHEAARIANACRFWQKDLIRRRPDAGAYGRDVLTIEIDGLDRLINACAKITAEEIAAAHRAALAEARKKRKGARDGKN